MDTFSNSLSWLVGRRPTLDNIVPKSDKKKSDSKKDAVTLKATFDADESHLSSKKAVLYAYLCFLAGVWADIADYLLGSFGSLCAFFFLIYVTVLLWPAAFKSKRFGNFDYKTRMQVRSIIIIKWTVVTALIGFPCWFFTVGDSRWFPDSYYFPPIRMGFLGYIAWYLVFDSKTSKCGARFLPGFRERLFWKHMASYFPISLTRTTKLDAKRNYLFGYHPHGIISLGCLLNFATTATGFDVLFPGIDIRVLTLEVNFRVPFIREVLIWMGINDASKESIHNNLTRKPGSSVALVIGGAAESLSAEPGNNDLVLANRKGFVKCALRTGASLVPIYSFGETDIYQVHHLEGRARQLQLKLQKALGFALPIFFGRALTGGVSHKIFGNKTGLFPLRVPIHTVVGKPIDCPKLEDAQITQEVIDKYHSLYVEELTKIFEEWKGDFEKEKAERIQKLEENPDVKDITDAGIFKSVKKEGKKMKLK